MKTAHLDDQVSRTEIRPMFSSDLTGSAGSQHIMSSIPPGTQTSARTGLVNRTGSTLSTTGTRVLVADD